MAFSSNDSGGPMASINVTPLVDVMLVLLIIFMITAPLMTHRIKVELPKANLNKKPPDQKLPPVTLSIKDDGSVYWNDEPLSTAQLDSKLATTAQLVPQPELDVRADKTTRFGIVWQTINMAKVNGMVKVGFISTATTHNKQ
jgi:biopolymer transport protein ExbD